MQSAVEQPFTRRLSDPSSLVIAYARATYGFERAGRRVQLHFSSAAGQESPASAIDLPRRWSIVTACNPGHAVLDASTNAERHARLAAMVSQSGLVATASRACDGRGEHTEVGLFIADITRDQALALARAFEQTAIVFGSGTQAGVIYTATERWSRMHAIWVIE